MRTVREGGTGSNSDSPTQPERLPDRFEAGSHSVVGLAGRGRGPRAGMGTAPLRRDG